MKKRNLGKSILAVAGLALGASLVMSPVADAQVHSQNGLILGDSSTFKQGIEEEIGTLLNKDTDQATKAQLIEFFQLKGYNNIGDVIKEAGKQGYDVSNFKAYENLKSWY